MASLLPDESAGRVVETEDTTVTNKGPTEVIYLLCYMRVDAPEDVHTTGTASAGEENE